MCLQFELDRTDVVEMRVEPLDVVETVDVLADGGLGSELIQVALVVDQLRTERGEEALGDGVVPAITRAAHALHDAACSQGGAVLVAGVGTTAIGVMDEACVDDASLEGAVERGQGKGRVVRVADRPADQRGGRTDRAGRRGTPSPPPSRCT